MPYRSSSSGAAWLRRLTWIAVACAAILFAPPAGAALQFISCGQTIQANDSCSGGNTYYFAAPAGQTVTFDLSSPASTSSLFVYDPHNDVVADDLNKAFPHVSLPITETSPNWSVLVDIGTFCASEAAYTLTMSCNSAPQACIPSGDGLELIAGRFLVAATYQTAAGATGTAQTVSLTGNSGYLWFFSPTNAELLVKVINACASFNRYWFFAAGLTNVGVELTVTDTASGQSKTYSNPVNQQFSPILDTNAFATCP